MSRARFSSAAERDVLEAQRYYARQSPGLDLSFKAESDQVLTQIRTYPASYPIVHKEIRRANLSRFHFGVSMCRGGTTFSYWEWFTTPAIQGLGSVGGDLSRG